MDANFSNIWLKSNLEFDYNDVSNNNSDSKNIYHGCFITDPQELGPQIQRPKAPIFTCMNSNQNIFLFQSSK